MYKPSEGILLPASVASGGVLVGTTSLRWQGPIAMDDMPWQAFTSFVTSHWNLIT